MQNNIEQNLAEVRERMEEACKRARRDKEDVTLVAVSKTRPAEDVVEAMRCGQRVFGENRVQEMREKSGVITDDIDWHLIGTLQTNKVKYLPGMARMVHSVDNLKLAEEISKQYEKRGLVCDAFIEVNMAREFSKMGLDPDDAFSFAKEISSIPAIKVKGLMTIAPFTDEPETNRVYFDGLRKLKDRINEADIFEEPLTELSMGMTGDFEVAIEEGATFIRVGTAIFGER